MSSRGVRRLELVFLTPDLEVLLSEWNRPIFRDFEISRSSPPPLDVWCSGVVRLRLRDRFCGRDRLALSFSGSVSPRSRGNLVGIRSIDLYQHDRLLVCTMTRSDLASILVSALVFSIIKIAFAHEGEDHAPAEAPSSFAVAESLPRVVATLLVSLMAFVAARWI